jgi:hypothetical protein
MTKKAWALAVLLVVFVAGVGGALWRELARDEATLRRSVSGIVEVSPALYAAGQADIVKTDRLVLVLVDPATGQPVALKFESPLVPPQNIRIGQQDVRQAGEIGNGPYLLIGITDKDGEIFHAAPGEVWGRLPDPVSLGMEHVKLLLDAPFRGGLNNDGGSAPLGAAALDGGYGAGAGSAGAAAAPPDPARTISGTITVAPKLAANVAKSDRLIVLLFDPELGRPAAMLIIPHALIPQKFSISAPDAAPGKRFFLRVISDKDNNPFQAAPGEVAGRSKEPIALGTHDITFELDEPYTR